MESDRIYPMLLRNFQRPSSKQRGYITNQSYACSVQTETRVEHEYRKVDQGQTPLALYWQTLGSLERGKGESVLQSLHFLSVNTWAIVSPGSPTLHVVQYISPTSCDGVAAGLLYYHCPGHRWSSVNNMDGGRARLHLLQARYNPNNSPP